MRQHRRGASVLLQFAVLVFLAVLPLSVSGATEYPLLNGTNNNLATPRMGWFSWPFRRLFPATSLPPVRSPSARAVSAALFSAPPALYSTTVSALATIFGNMVTFDICHFERGSTERMDIPVPKCDTVFDPQCLGDQNIAFDRSAFVAPETTPRKIRNMATHWLDASHYYGTNDAEGAAQREFVGGRLLMPLNASVGNNTAMPGFVPGSNIFSFPHPLLSVQPTTGALAVIFRREHNRFVKLKAQENPKLTDEELYQLGRMRVSALINRSLFYEYVPLLIGQGLPVYAGYNPNITGVAFDEFCTVAWRYGHSAQFSTVYRSYPTGPAPEGHLLLREHFLNMAQVKRWNVDSLIYGAATNTENVPDEKFITDLTSTIPGAGIGLNTADPALKRTANIDLPATNIQRGRDHELATFNEARKALGLVPFTKFTQFLPNCATQLPKLYTSIDDVDLYTGAMCEPPRLNALLGEVLCQIVTIQMTTIRDADRFWFENPDSPAYSLVKQYDLRNLTALAEEQAGPGISVAPFPSSTPYRRAQQHQSEAQKTDPRFKAEADSNSDSSSSSSSDSSSSSSSSSTGSGGASAKIDPDSLASIIKLNTDLTDFPANPFGILAKPILPKQSGTSVTLTDWYTLTWELDEDAGTIKFIAIVKNDGFVGLGWGLNKMVNADIVMGWLKPDGTPKIADCLAITFGVPNEDSSLGGDDNLLQKSFSVVDGVSTLTFKRKLKTGDFITDNAIDPSVPLEIIFATGPHSRDKHQSNRRASAIINLRSGTHEVEVTYPISLYIHGGGMALGWLVLAPLAVYFVRYKKTQYKWWLSAHKLLIGFAVGSILPLFITAALNTSGTIVPRKYHTFVAYIFLGFVILQLAIGNVMAFSLNLSAYAVQDRFRWARIIHRVMGRLLILFAFAQVATGLKELRLPFFVWYIFIGWLGFLAFLFISEELKSRKPIHKYIQVAPDGSTSEGGSGDGESLPKMSRVAFNTGVKQGKPWLIIEGFIVDMQPILDTHAGGQAILTSHLGKDATAAFNGLSRTSKHPHSKPARKRMLSMRIATLITEGTTLASVVELKTKVASRLNQANHVDCVITKYNILEKSSGGTSLLEIITEPVSSKLLSLPFMRPGQHIVMSSFTGDNDGKGKNSSRGKNGKGEESTSGSTAVDIRREYTPTRYDQTSGRTEFLIRLIPGGEMSAHIATLSKGSKVSLSLYKPHGESIDPPEGTRHLLFLAGGTGIAPFLFFLREVHANSFSPMVDIPMTLVVFNRGAPLLADELSMLERDMSRFNALKVEQVVTSPPRGWKGRTGRISVELLNDILKARDLLGVVEGGRLMTYYAGPPGFEQSVKELLGPVFGTKLMHLGSGSGEEAEQPAPLIRGESLMEIFASKRSGSLKTPQKGALSGDKDESPGATPMSPGRKNSMKPPGLEMGEPSSPPSHLLGRKNSMKPPGLENRPSAEAPSGSRLVAQENKTRSSVSTTASAKQESTPAPAPTPTPAPAPATNSTAKLLSTERSPPPGDEFADGKKSESPTNSTASDVSGAQLLDNERGRKTNPQPAALPAPRMSTTDKDDSPASKKPAVPPKRMSELGIAPPPPLPKK